MARLECVRAARRATDGGTRRRDFINLSSNEYDRERERLARLTHRERANERASEQKAPFGSIIVITGMMPTVAIDG